MLKDYHVIDGAKTTNMQDFPFLTASFETDRYSVDVTLCIGKLVILHCAQCIFISVITVRIYRGFPNIMSILGQERLDDWLRTMTRFVYIVRGYTFL